MKKMILVLITLIFTACSTTEVTPPGTVVIIEHPTSAASTTQPSTPQQPELPLFPSVTPNPAGSEILFTATPGLTPATIPKLQARQDIEISFIQMLDSETGWAIESKSHILHTVDGGNTWQDVTPPQGAFMEGGFFAGDAKTAWATFFTGLYTPVSSAFVWYTTDGGQNWQASQPFPVNLDREGKSVPNDYYRPQMLYFLDQHTGWLLVDVYYGMNSTRLLLFRTGDGGKTWVLINDHYHDLQEAIGVGVAFIDQETGWYGQNAIPYQWGNYHIDEIVADGGWKLSKTLDGGRTFTGFTLLPLPAEIQKPELAGKNADCGETRMLTIAPGVIGVEWTCWIYAVPRQDYSFFALTSDGGQSWQSWLATGNEFFLNAQTGWRLSPTISSTSRGLQKTTDSGRSWLSIKTVAWQVARLDFVDEQVGWAIVKTGNAAALVHTADGGQTWAEIKPVISP